MRPIDVETQAKQDMIEVMLAEQRRIVRPVAAISLTDWHMYGFRAWHSHQTVDDDTHIIRLESEIEGGTVQAWTLTMEQAEQFAKQLTDAVHFAKFYVPRSQQ